MPTVTPEVRKRWQADYDAARALLDAQIEKCRYCKSAKTRARGTSRANEAICSAHRSTMRAIWCTSPISETYWAS